MSDPGGTAQPPSGPSGSSAVAPDAKAQVKPAKPVKPPNRVWRMMGLPNMRMRLPSRNWLIFLSLTGSISAAIVYDKREKKRAQRKWCKLVEHLAKEPIGPRDMPRTLTVFLQNPPADGLRVAQDHFKDYVKPILVASGLDWEFIQGRKEGDVRAELAEKIRKLRQPPDQEPEDEDPAMRIRRQNGLTAFDGPQGDIVIGRHTWKEYIRGLHEGWLGPLTAPAPASVPHASEEIQSTDAVTDEAEGASSISEPSNVSETKTSEAAEPAPENPEKAQKPKQPPPFISTSAYFSAQTPPNLPIEFDPSEPISFPHILGFLNTGVRLYRFLNQRYMADDIGHDVAAIILANSRPYQSTVSEGATSPESTSFLSDSPTSTDATFQPASEQSLALAQEEKDWHKSIQKPVEGSHERTWLDDMVLDPRIASRMRRAELTPEDEERARSIVVPEDEVEGWIKGTARHSWKSAMTYLGVGVKKKMTPAEQGLVEDDLN
ncbi:MAG: mitochondrial import inner membrane translocase subunit tim54 [Claussenomyces sp. TS43310]|nr:MAG: mitochondrial import inner membrane translocase subunit tim54 [Claussenomyces sp. TS43310]